MSIDHKYLIIVSGPTAVGKTDVTIDLALKYDCPILSCDSRQIYKELNIGTAKVTKSEQKGVRHHFIDHLSIHEPYSAGRYEEEAITLLDELFTQHRVLILTGGTGLYIQAITEGLDDFPDVEQDIIDKLEDEFQRNGLLALSQNLKERDPEYYEQVDKQNSRRVIRALSIIQQTGQKFSDFLNRPKKKRNFTPIKILLNRDRQKLYDRINLRVDQMMEKGLLDEVKSLVEHQYLKSLQTVGYQELFSHLDGETDLSTAVELIKRNSRRYAKRQLTWFRRDPEWQSFHPNNIEEINAYINGLIQ